MSQGYEIYNPKNRPVEELPVIYGFNNGGAPGYYTGVLMCEDGTVIGSHLCSDEWFMYGDLGILQGARPDRHEGFRKHYPDGYRMDFVRYADVPGHQKLQEAFKKNEKLPAPEVKL